MVGLVDGDVLVLKPMGRTKKAEVSASLTGIFSWCLRNRALSVQLEKARHRKARLQAIRERRRLAAAECCVIPQVLFAIDRRGLNSGWATAQSERSKP